MGTGHGLNTSGTNIALTPKIERTIIQRQREKIIQAYASSGYQRYPCSIAAFYGGRSGALDAIKERSIGCASVRLVADVFAGKKTP